MREDEHQRQIRHRNNLIATAFILVLAICAVYVIKAMLEDQKLQRCLASGRRNCAEITAP